MAYLMSQIEKLSEENNINVELLHSNNTVYYMLRSMDLDRNKIYTYTFAVKYDWVKWLETGQICKQKTINLPKDVSYSSENIEIDWHKYSIKDRIQRYFLSLCSNVNHFKLFNIVETNHV